jgi:hypothetical protein
MRIAALIFGLLGAAGSGFLGLKWTSDANDPKNKAAVDVMRKINEEVKDPDLTAKLAHADRVTAAAYALIGGAAAAAIACVLVLNRTGLLAALLFFIGFATPLVLIKDVLPAIFTFGLALAGLFSLFVKPRVSASARRERGIPADADMVG